MGWFSSSDDDDQARWARQERDTRRSIKEQQASHLAWAEREAERDPDSTLAQTILRHAREGN